MHSEYPPDMGKLESYSMAWDTEVKPNTIRCGRCVHCIDLDDAELVELLESEEVRKLGEMGLAACVCKGEPTTLVCRRHTQWSCDRAEKAPEEW